jgi:excisionase family DNA binding protein
MSILKKLRERAEPLTVAQLAKLLVVTAATVQRWARQRQIPCIRIGDVIRFDGGMLADWFELQAASTRPLRAPSNPEDYLHWEELGELVPKEPVIRQQKASG